tara:strand:+ start:454 stop:1752 length:1299 start_codon:yes stop_codon:yes gene_type:complete
MKYNKSIIIFLIFIKFVFSQDIEELFEKGEVLVNEGYIDSSDKIFNMCLELDNSFAPAYIGISKNWLIRGDLKKANELATKAVQIDEDFRSWWNELNEINNKIQSGRQSDKLKNFDEAITIYESIIKKYPNCSEVYFYMGHSRYKQKDMAAAAAYWKKSIEIYPNHSKSKKGLGNITKKYFRNGNAAYKRGDVDGAIQNYEKAIDFDPSYYLAYFQLGVIEKKSGNHSKAIDYLKQAAQIEPKYEKTWYTIATAYESESNLDSAIANYSKAIFINPDYHKAHGQLGSIYTLKKEYDLAEESLKTSVGIEPSYAIGYYKLGLVYHELNRLDSAIQSYKSSLEIDSKNFDVWFKIASVYNLKNNFSDGALAAKKATELKRTFGGGWYEYGISELGKGNKTRAKKYFETARKDRKWRKLAELEIDKLNNPVKYQK